VTGIGIVRTILTGAVPFVLSFVIGHSTRHRFTEEEARGFLEYLREMGVPIRLTPAQMWVKNSLIGGTMMLPYVGPVMTIVQGAGIGLVLGLLERATGKDLLGHLLGSPHTYVELPTFSLLAGEGIQSTGAAMEGRPIDLGRKATVYGAGVALLGLSAYIEAMGPKPDPKPTQT